MQIQYQRGLKRSLQTHFGSGFSRLEQFLEILPATLPHTNLAAWSRRDRAETSGSHLQGDTGNRVLNIAISYSHLNGQKYTLYSKLKKVRAFGVYERTFVNSIVREIGRVVDTMATRQSDHLLIGPQEMADAAVANFLQNITGITDTDFVGIIRFLKEMAQQSYETKPITYGVIVLTRTESKRHIASFPYDIIDQKRFQSITDGYNTALLLDRAGKIIRLISLESQGRVGEHFRPTWLDPLAETARSHQALGIALTRAGALMIAWQGNLLLSYRHGKWTLWYHSENVELIRDGLTRRGTVPRDMARLAAKLYRCALDVSFRKTGALFVALRSPTNIEKLVKGPEQINGGRRTRGDLAIGEWLSTHTVVGTERKIITDLSALDGAIVCDRRGNVLSYGSVLLLPRKKGLSRIEGSRSRAAHSASFFGLSIKISSDGGIEVIESGQNLLSL
jgi:hypothetical protein